MQYLGGLGIGIDQQDADENNHSGGQGIVHQVDVQRVHHRVGNKHGNEAYGSANRDIPRAATYITA